MDKEDAMNVNSNLDESQVQLKRIADAMERYIQHNIDTNFGKK